MAEFVVALSVTTNFPIRRFSLAGGTDGGACGHQELMGAASEEYAFPFAFPDPLLFRRRVRAPAVAVYRRFPAESSNHGGELITSGSGSFIMPPLLVVP